MSQEPDPPQTGERIAKLLARAGVGSRRAVELMISEGRVHHRGTPVTTPATLLTALEGITVDGKPVAAVAPPRLWRFHKPRGVITTHKDPQGRRTVFDLLPPGAGRLISVGRLDLNSEGLLLLTNDGALARHLEHPATGLARRYRVRVHGEVDEARLGALIEGITVEGVRYGPITASLERAQGSNAWLIVTLHEGKNREIRKVLAALGLMVTRLIRIAYGPFGLGQLAPGEMKPVPPNDWAPLARPIAGALAGASDATLSARPKGWAKPKPRRRGRKSRQGG
ncbi:MAG: pseudouridine synthase [Pseudomonadota bacterium]